MLMWELAVDTSLDDAQIATKVRNITRLRVADPCNVKCPVEPYGPNNPVPEVSTLNYLCFALVECFS